MFVMNFGDFSQMFKQHCQHFAIFVSICAESCPKCVGISQIAQKILPHTEYLRKILGFFKTLNAKII